MHSQIPILKFKRRRKTKSTLTPGDPFFSYVSHFFPTSRISFLRLAFSGTLAKYFSYVFSAQTQCTHHVHGGASGMHRIGPHAQFICRSAFLGHFSTPSHCAQPAQQGHLPVYSKQTPQCRTSLAPRLAVSQCQLRRQWAAWSSPTHQPHVASINRNQDRAKYVAIALHPA